MSAAANASAPVLISMGEPCGIGPEVAVAAFHALKGQLRGRPVKLVGDPDVFRACGDVPDAALIPTQARATRTPGTLNPANAPAVIEAIRLSVEMCLRGEAAALTTAPIHKAVLMEAGFRFPGHTDYLAELTHGTAVMMLAGAAVRVVPVTVHVPLADVPRLLTRDLLLDTARTTLAALKNDFGIAHPRLAVAGLNPHAGEDGKLGHEEIDTIIPVIETLRAEGAEVLGPMPSDTMFHQEARARYDAALCMYHDQGLIPMKTLCFWDGVNVTLGLPVVRTSPDHGTGLDIAGRGRADHRSMIAALQMAADISDARSRGR